MFIPKIKLIISELLSKTTKKHQKFEFLCSINNNRYFLVYEYTFYVKLNVTHCLCKIVDNSGVICQGDYYGCIKFFINRVYGNN